MRVRFSRRAQRDIEEIYRYLVDKSPLGAQNVLRSIREAAELIGRNPYAAPKTDDSEIRIRVVRQYRYKIFFRITSDVEIIHVRHPSRRPLEIER
jgi:plasmid stabilization system protein ParE